MNGMDDMLNLLFQDKPIPQESLCSLQDGIMNQIFAHPVDFQAELLRAKRRKWGFIYLSALVLIGMGFLFIAWFAGDRLQQAVAPFSSWILINVPGFRVIGNVWVWFIGKWTLLTQIKLGVETLWQQYAFSIMGIALMWVLFEGVREKGVYKEQ